MPSISFQELRPTAGNVLALQTPDRSRLHQHFELRFQLNDAARQVFNSGLLRFHRCRLPVNFIIQFDHGGQRAPGFSVTPIIRVARRWLGCLRFRGADRFAAGGNESERAVNCPTGPLGGVLRGVRQRTNALSASLDS